MKPSASAKQILEGPHNDDFLDFLTDPTKQAFIPVILRQKQIQFPKRTVFYDSGIQPFFVRASPGVISHQLRTLKVVGVKFKLYSL
jgi:hypothetical protein